MTMKMGLERGLLEAIPEILAVEQVSASGEALCDETVMEVLDEIRPFLKNMGGDIELIRVDATDLQPSCTLRLTGPSATLRSIKGEIIQARPHDQSHHHPHPPPPSRTPPPHPAPPARPAPPRPPAHELHTPPHVHLSACETRRSAFHPVHKAHVRSPTPLPLRSG